MPPDHPEKVYELSYHVGKVLAGDFKVQDEQAVVIGGVNFDVPFYWASIVQQTDYCPSGMEMPGRRYVDGRHRFGFQGQEHDDEWLGEGNALSFITGCTMCGWGGFCCGSAGAGVS